MLSKDKMAALKYRRLGKASAKVAPLIIILILPSDLLFIAL